MGTDGSNGHKDETIIMVIIRMITAVILITIILMMIIIMVLITVMALAMILIKIRNHINRNETLEAILNITSDSKCTWTSEGRAPCSC